ncbi:MAG: phosphate/phosphite/phosphonate ABC transporter substrate-binding protein [Gammaproteobacteria bacterium]|nr:phosphate/phosphite/phosphonate ABC transporter substrate-binding protein [Gammaproteobacteria bacterium]MDH3768262.1 phosphate/phosphite/phosphonate ABC transporter substrate-binding protein [Gammaproteobacteria bacterium]
MKILTLILAMTVCACANDDDRKSSAPDVITIGVLPDQNKSDLTRRYAPLMDYLETETGLDIVLSIPSDYEEFLDEFNAGHLQLANFGGMTFIQAEQKSQAVPLVMRDIDLQFTSCYIINASDGRRSVAEFEGEVFSFGPNLSTSGHIMPRYFLITGGIVPERFFSSVQYSSGHDQTAKWVSDEIVAIGVANCDIVQSMFDDGRLSTAKLRILETTPPYPNYVWATQASLDLSLKHLLRDAFLGLDLTNPMHLPLLKAQGAGGYLPAGRDDFEDIRAAVRELASLVQSDPN